MENHFFDNHLEAVQLGYLSGVIADPPYLIAGGSVDPLEDQ
jgi:hypothetical protein